MPIWKRYEDEEEAEAETEEVGEEEADVQVRGFEVLYENACEYVDECELPCLSVTVKMLVNGTEYNLPTVWISPKYSNGKLTALLTLSKIRQGNEIDIKDLPDDLKEAFIDMVRGFVSLYEGMCRSKIKEVEIRDDALRRSLKL